MTLNNEENQAQSAQPTEQPNNKEYNFRMLEAKYQRQLELERQEKEQLKQQLQSRQQPQEEEDSDEPYVAPKQLQKKLNQFGQNTQSEIQKAMELAKQQAKEELKQEMFLEKNRDFYDVLQNAEKLAQHDPELAETILTMPNNFERQKLVYKNIKALGLDRPTPKQPSIQEKVDANRRSPYYQPSGVGSAPYAQVGDFSQAGQKNAYDQLQKLKQRLSLG